MASGICSVLENIAKMQLLQSIHSMAMQRSMHTPRSDRRTKRTNQPQTERRNGTMLLVRSHQIISHHHQSLWASQLHRTESIRAMSSIIDTHITLTTTNCSNKLGMDNPLSTLAQKSLAHHHLIIVAPFRRINQ